MLRRWLEVDVRVRLRGVDRLEVGLIAVLALLAGAVLAPRHDPPEPGPEAAWLERTYGPGRQSQYLEEWIVRDFFRDRAAGVFVDVGAAHPKQFSNTWFLEQDLHWSGVAVDAQREFAPAYGHERPRTRFRTFFVSDSSSERVTLFLNGVDWVASSSQDFTKRWGDLQERRDVETITLDDLLAAEGIDRFDFLSMDIELAEPRALAGLDLKRFGPALVCVEAHPEVRQQILDYFAARDYVPAGKYLRVDDHNLWFIRRGTAIAPFPKEVSDQWTH